MKTVIEMAREANDYATAELGVNAIPREWRALRDEQFAAIVRDDERRAIYVELDKTDSAVDEVLAEYKAAMQMALEALEDLVNGWKYIRSSHGDLYGVGWDRAEGKGDTAITAMREALAQPQVSDYDCEFWGDGQPQGEWVDLASAWAEGYESGINDERESEACIGIAGFGAKISPNRQNPYTKNTSPVVPQGEWVDLTDDEILTAANVSQEDIYDLDLLNVLSDVRAIIAKFKEKNTPPVAPQGKQQDVNQIEAMVNLHDAAFVRGFAAGKLYGQANPEPQEPVAWWEFNEDIGAWFLAYTFNPKAKTRPLVFGDAAPVRTKDLTDEEIMKINVDTASIVPTCDRQFHFARAVIAADREKNK